MSSALQIIEAETPRKALRHASTRRIWPGQDYFLNVIKRGEQWKDGEFCPVGVYHDMSAQAFDGMYGLLNDVEDAIGYRDNDPASEEEMSKWMDHYEGEMFRQLRLGRVSGQIDGIAGPRSWRLVYMPRSATVAIPVVPGKQYGPPMVAEAETPKSVFKQMGRGDFVGIALNKYVTRQGAGRVERVGSFDIDARGHMRQTKLEDVPEFTQELAMLIVRDLKRGSTKGVLYRTPLSWEMIGGDEHAQGMIDRSAPMLVVQTPAWKIQTPLYVDNQFFTYTWNFQGLTPEQRQFMFDHGERIYIGMNEGNEFEGTIVDYDNDEAEIPLGKYYVTGEISQAPEGAMVDHYGA